MPYLKNHSDLRVDNHTREVQIYHVQLGLEDAASLAPGNIKTFINSWLMQPPCINLEPVPKGNWEGLHLSFLPFKVHFIYTALS